MSGPGPLGVLGGLRERLGACSFGGGTTRRVLVLQGEIAVWTLWREGRRVDVKIERADEDGSDDRTCPWPASGETLVDVVADSPLDDVERVLASEAGRAPGPLSRRRLLRRLARRHRDAVVRAAPPDAFPLLASLLGAELPDSWRDRLEALQRGPVTIVSLHSAIRLREPPAEDRTGDVLHIVRGGGTERHTLYRSGCPTFTRVVALVGPDDARTALGETLAHLGARHGVAAPRERRFPAGEGDAEADGLHDAHALAAHALGAGRRGSITAVPGTLFDKHRRHVELRRLHVATALTAAIAGSTVLASAVHGIDSARRRARAVVAEEALVLRVDRLIEIVDGRHPTPHLADASLAQLERHRSMRAPDAHDVLALIADVLTEHPAVRLERLEWSTPDDADPDPGTRPESASSQPVRRVTAEGVVAEPAVAWLELAGRIDAAGALSVRERQRRFEAFAAALGRRAGVTGLRVRLSPAGAAATPSDGMRTSSPSDEYALQLRYAERS